MTRKLASTLSALLLASLLGCAELAADPRTSPATASARSHQAQDHAADDGRHPNHPGHGGHEGQAHEHQGHRAHDHPGHDHRVCGHHVSTVPDLQTIKDQLIAYHDSGRYAAEQRAVVERAHAFLASRVAKENGSGKKLAMVLDVDETALSNWPEIVGTNFGYVRPSWNEWVERAEAWAIDPVLELYRFARAHDVAVFFITGRREHQRAATAKNLDSAGYAGFQELILKPDDSKVAFAALYKAAERKRITGAGYHIVLSLGDQQSDLDGGFADGTFKLPNPFYRVP